MLTFLCVLKSGGDFTPKYVDKLRQQVNLNYSMPHEFICLTDLHVDCGVPLIHNLPGWWSKFEMFRFPGPVIYLDLDNIIVGSLNSLETLTVLSSNTIYPLKAFRDGLPGTSVMAWTGDYSWVLDNFLYDLPGWEYIKGGVGLVRTRDGVVQPGDQDAFREILYEADESYTFVNDLGLKIVSYKWHCGDILPEGANIVGFHGKPRPPEALASWVRKYWGDN